MMKSITRDIFSFNSQEWMCLFYVSCFSSLPFVIPSSAVVRIFAEIHPQARKADSVDKSSSANFVITQSTDTDLNKIAHLFIEKAITKFPRGRSFIESQRESFEARTVRHLKNMRQMALETAQGFGNQRIDIGFSFADGSIMEEWRYSVRGGRASSYFSAPLIKIHYEAAEIAKSWQNGVKPASEDMLKFVQAHEVSHIVLNHNLAKAITVAAFAIFNTGLWGYFWYGNCTLPTTLIIALGASLIYHIFLAALSRFQEKQADLTACNYLKTNKGALELLGAVSENKHETINLFHPPQETRIEYLRQWEKCLAPSHPM